MLTNKQIARLIVDAYNAGRDDGEEEGYKLGYEVEEDEEERGEEDMTGQTCEKCSYDTYEERSWNDDRNGTLQCSCGHVVDRWRKYEDDRRAQGWLYRLQQEEMSSKEAYNAGWNDGYHGFPLNLTMKEDRVYLWGYGDGKEEKIEGK